MTFDKRKKYWNSKKIQSSIFFHIDVERLERNSSDAKIYGQYFYKNVYICGLCGEIVDIWGTTGAYQHIAEYHPEWVESYIILPENIKRKRIIDPIDRINLKISSLSYLYDRLILLELDSLKEKRSPLKEKRKEIQEPKRIVFLKPWKDPESLFCDTKFLEELLCKEITKGDECKDKKSDV